MKFRPLHDKILVKRLDAEEKTPGGLVIPETAKDKPIRGHVIAVGSGKALDNGAIQEPRVSPGDKVLFVKYGGQEVKLDGEEHLIMRESDILGVLEE